MEGQAAARGRILVITPCHNEAEYLPRTIAAMARQERRPTLWLIVDDGSEDRTGEIADEAAARHPEWIRVLHRPRRRERSVGPGVIDAFYAGLEEVGQEGWDYLCKFDGDLDFGPRLFRGLVERMEAEPRLGTFSGKIWEDLDGELRYLRTGDDFSLGMCKFYRTQAFQEIGGFVREVMWDGIDCHRCRMAGWEARSEDREELRLIHLRQMGSSHKSIHLGRRRWGRGQYFMGTHPLYLLAICTYRLCERPWIMGGLNILWGYTWSWLTRKPRYEDPRFRRFLRRWQLRRLGLGFLVPGERDD